MKVLKIKNLIRASGICVIGPAEISTNLKTVLMPTLEYGFSVCTSRRKVDEVLDRTLATAVKSLLGIGKSSLTLEKLHYLD
jgi:hypothetical protein